MSRHKSVEIRCDGCGYSRHTISTTFNEAEIKVRKSGWNIEGTGKETKHYCPKCVGEGLNNERE